MIEQIIDNLLKLPKECEWAEFKLNFHSKEEIGENISALSNGACIKKEPFGYLMFGIDDKTITVEGTTFHPNSYKIGNEEFENWLMQRLSPRIDVEIFETQYQGKQVAIFKIPAAHGQPTAFINIDYIKVGSITRKLKDFPEKERKIWLSLDRTPFESKTAQCVQSFDDVMSLLDTHCYFDSLNLPYPKTQNGVAEKFISEKLVRQTMSGYEITNLGAILFAKDMSRFDTLKRKSVRVIQYKGKNKMETLKDQEGKYGYVVGFKGLVKYIMDILPSNEIIKESLRKDVTMYPELAIRELVANALIHQDFDISGTGPMIELFSDRIEISSPGHPLIQPNRFIDEYQSRNETLASIMRRFGICEEKGSGLDKVVESIELFQLPAYDIQVQETHTKVILYSYLPFAKMDKGDKVRACYQHACLRYVMNEKMTNTSLRERFKISPSNSSMVSRIIRDTLAEHLIKEEDPENTSKKYIRYVPIWA